MKITFLAHASFLIVTDKQTKLITDPYEAGCFKGALGYKPIKESADIVLVSHEHDDHNCVADVLGNPEVIKGTGSWTIKDIRITGLGTYHDTQKGSARGNNVIFVIEVAGLRIAHLGDLGHSLSQSEYKAIGKIDILLIPVGGYFTIDSKIATEIMNSLKPSITIPMHYKTAVLDFPIAKVDEFIKDKKNVKKFDKPDIEINRQILPQTPEIWILKMVKE